MSVTIGSVTEYINSGNLQAAKQAADTLFKLHPQNEAILLLHAEIKAHANEDAQVLHYAQAALKLSHNPDLFLNLIIRLFKGGKFNNAWQIAQIALPKYSTCYPLLNIMGLILKNQKRFEQAIVIFEQAIAINPQEASALINKGNTCGLIQKNQEALACYSQILEHHPNHVEALRLQALAYLNLHNHQKALEILQYALSVHPEEISIIAELCFYHHNNKNYEQALKIVTTGLNNVGNNAYLLRTKGIILTQVGLAHEAIHIFKTILQHNPGDIETILYLANTYYHTLGNKIKAKEYYELAYAKAPNNESTLKHLCNFLYSVRNKDGSEGADLERAHQLACRLLSITPSPILASDTLQSIFLNMIDHDNYNQIGDRNQMISYWMSRGTPSPLTNQMSRCTTVEDKKLLLEAHKAWGKQVEAVAIKQPIRYVRRKLNNKIRIGILSSDLRSHPVGYFTWPIIEHLNREQFEIYCYSAYPHEADYIQQVITRSVDKFTSFREEKTRDVAQAIANDGLDIMFELGGNTIFNRTEVCAYKPAPIQVSWLGYPHSIGLTTTMDYIMLDKYINPQVPGLIIEKPFIMPNTWVSLDKVGFSANQAFNSTPQMRTGYITFGTMNMPHKITPKAFEVWAGIMHMVPNSRFLYVRPETIVPALQINFTKYMAKYGITADRIAFASTRTHHIHYYNLIDIALDTFSHTGGTITCEALWMGVPVVTLVGDAFFERISYSNLNNCGLGELCAFDLQQYHNIAVNLANDKAKREYLRHNLRTQILQHPLGQPRQFAQDFGDKVKDIINA